MTTRELLKEMLSRSLTSSEIATNIDEVIRTYNLPVFRNAILGNEYIDKIEPYDEYDPKVYECTESQFIIQKAIKCSQVNDQIDRCISDLPSEWSNVIERRIPYPEFSDILNAIKTVVKEEFYNEESDHASIEEMADLIIEFNKQAADTYHFFTDEEYSALFDDFFEQFKACNAHPVLNTCLIKKQDGTATEMKPKDFAAKVFWRPDNPDSTCEVITFYGDTAQELAKTTSDFILTKESSEGPILADCHIGLRNERLRIHFQQLPRHYEHFCDWGFKKVFILCSSYWEEWFVNNGYETDELGAKKI